MKAPLLFTLTALLFIPVYSFTQNEANHWMFGQNVGIDFSSGAPVPESGCALISDEGTAAISDPVTGNLLMYTDGTTVYTANHTPMPNGTGLNGFPSSTQAALIVPQPGSSTHFYIFTSDAVENVGAAGYNYSVVDLTLNGGLGDVVPTQKNILLYAPGGEQLSAVKHANCTDWWIMTKELGNNVYRAYLLTSTGISTSVSSAIGISIPLGCYGQAKFSPDGTKYAISTGNGLSKLTQLFDFDNTTGLLSNPITIESSNGGPSDAYGLCFSGDNSKLYACRGDAARHIYQYDLSSGAPATIIASGMLIGDQFFYAQLQLGKDFKIYIPDFLNQTLSVINNPNALGAACGFSTSSISTTGTYSIGVCNFPDSYFNQSSPCSSNGDVLEEVELTPHIPNIITPNGDGVNDVFTIDNLPPASSLDILNRWGNPVLTTDDYTNDWTGNNSDGVYFYRLKLSDGRNFSGFVQVVTSH